MGLGAAAGLALHAAPDHGAAGYGALLWWLGLIGKGVFIGALKMIIGPLILASIVAGVTSMPSFAETGRVGVKALVYYLATTSIAVAIGLGLVLTIQPGKRASSQEIRASRKAELDRRREEYRRETGRDPTAEGNRAAYRGWLAVKESAGSGTDAERLRRVAAEGAKTTGDIFRESVVDQLLMNPFRSLAEMNSLGVIFFAIVLGLACVALGSVAAPVTSFFQAANEVILCITGWIMAISPLAIFCLVASLLAEKGPSVFGSVGWYVGTVIGGIGIHVVALLAIVALVGRMNPLRFLRGIREAWAIAFATRSSAATLPVTMRNVIEKLGVSPKVAEFTLPVGATVNMDGTALYEGVAVIFLIQIYGGLDDVTIALGGAITLVIFITAVLASIGAAAVPDAGLVTMVLVATAVGLPVYYIPLVFAVDAFLDMFRTSTNVMGDAVGAVVVDRLEGARLRPAPPA